MSGKWLDSMIFKHIFQPKCFYNMICGARNKILKSIAAMLIPTVCSAGRKYEVYNFCILRL